MWHARVHGQDYDDFVEEFVSAVCESWPHVLLQWEDFAKSNATRLLDRYRDRLCTFNDDIQGTAAVATGTLLSAIQVTGVPLANQRVCIVGAGSAGCGIANLLMEAMIEAGLTREDARKRFFMVDYEGLLVRGMNSITSFQEPFLRDPSQIAHWSAENPGRVSLLDVVRNASTNPPDRVKEFSLKVGGGTWDKIFNGSQRMLSWDNVVWISRTVLKP